MSFFNSDIVRSEMEEIIKLQEIIYENVFKFPFMFLEDKKNHINVLQNLLEKQKVLYTRLSLSEDPEAKIMKENIIQSTIEMGLPKNVDMNTLFNKMSEIVELMKSQIGET